MSEQYHRLQYEASLPYCGHVQSQVDWGIHCHDFYEVYMVTRGSCIHYVNGKEKILTRRNLTFIRPNDYHEGRKHISDEVVAVNIAMTIEEVEEKLELTPHERRVLLESSDPPSVMLSETAMEYLNEKMCRALAYEDDPEAKFRLLRRVMHLVVAELVYPSVESIEVPGWFSRMLIDYENEENKMGGLDDLVKYSGMSYSHVSHSFKKFMDMTPSEYIVNYRLRQVKRLLTETDREVIEICYACGFESSSYFYKVFRRNTGMTPSKYRKTFTNNIKD